MYVLNPDSIGKDWLRLANEGGDAVKDSVWTKIKKVFKRSMM